MTFDGRPPTRKKRRRTTVLDLVRHASRCKTRTHSKKCKHATSTYWSRATTLSRTACHAPFKSRCDLTAEQHATVHDILVLLLFSYHPRWCIRTTCSPMTSNISRNSLASSRSARSTSAAVAFCKPSVHGTTTPSVCTSIRQDDQSPRQSVHYKSVK